MATVNPGGGGSRAGDKSIDAWIADLAGEPEHCGQRAVAALVERGRDAVVALGDALSDRRWRVRVHAAVALSSIGRAAQPACVPLLRALRDPKARVRRACLAALEQLGTGASPAVQVVRTCLADRDADVRRLAARALIAIGRSDPAIRAELIRRLDDPVGDVRAESARALARLARGDAVAAAAVGELFVIDEESRPAAAAAFAQLDAAGFNAICRADPTLLDRRPSESRPSSSPLVAAALAAPEALAVDLAIVGLECQPEEAIQALIALGARAAPALPALGTMRSVQAVNAARAIAFAVAFEEARGRPPRRRSQVDPERRRLAALLGSPSVDGERVAPVVSKPRTRADVEVLSHAFAGLGPESRARIGHALARRVLPLWDLRYSAPHPDAAVMALEDWIVDPSEDHRRQLESAADASKPNQWCDPAPFSAAWVAVHACQAAIAVDGTSTLTALTRSFLDALMGSSTEPIAGWRPPGGCEPVPLDEREACDALDAALRHWVLPWALDDWDPVSDTMSPLRS